MLVGLISDTHGLLRPEAIEALRGVDVILHAGDVGAAEVIERLRLISPVHAIRGNVDRGEWPETLDIELDGRRVYLIHDRKQLRVDPAHYAMVVSGHSHQPGWERRDGVLFVNPGSAGPRRFRLPITVARLDTAVERWEPKLLQL